MTDPANGFLSRDGDDVYFETFGAPDAPVVVLGHGAGGNHGDLVPTGAGVRTRLPRHHVGPARLRQLDEPQRAREPAHRDRRPARDPRPPRVSSARTSSASRWAAGPRWASRSSTAIACGASCSPTRSAASRSTDGGRRPRRFRRASGCSIIPRSSNDFCIAQSRTRAPLPADRRAAPGSARRPASQLLRELGRGDVHRRRSSPPLAHPTLFIVGSDDEIFPPGVDRRRGPARSRARGSRSIEGAGHSPYFEQPDAWNALVQGFWFHRGRDRGEQLSQRRRIVRRFGRSPVARPERSTELFRSVPGNALRDVHGIMRPNRADESGGTR